MTERDKFLTPLDRFLSELDHALRTTLASPSASRQTTPADTAPENPLSESQLRLSQGLMRINHSGEIAAQALYRGQAVLARDEQQQNTLLRAAGEELDHLHWCQQRLSELNSRVSKFVPAWYAGSFLIGIVAGLAGDRWSLGFVEETENQVSVHLKDHLQRLPRADQRSRAIVTRMLEDESRHAAAAKAAGAQELPVTIKAAMTQIANLMRFVSFRI
ncbi:MAG: 2-polyprenyl-3-methyl-6-methoxy-1,4-benzoquinone monooxygenase [Gammaproteobacteria bacterium]|nr:2-polyprenyl-3-methyl-6-methoxy-1,4-benzoquinone monooxygenase [Gammaproteobacteria bacterium]